MNPHLDFRMVAEPHGGPHATEAVGRVLTGFRGLERQVNSGEGVVDKVLLREQVHRGPVLREQALVLQLGARLTYQTRASARCWFHDVQWTRWSERTTRTSWWRYEQCTKVGTTKLRLVVSFSLGVSSSQGTTQEPPSKGKPVFGHGQQVVQQSWGGSESFDALQGQGVHHEAVTWSGSDIRDSTWTLGAS